MIRFGFPEARGPRLRDDGDSAGLFPHFDAAPMGLFLLASRDSCVPRFSSAMAAIGQGTALLPWAELAVRRKEEGEEEEERRCVEDEGDERRREGAE